MSFDSNDEDVKEIPLKTEDLEGKYNRMGRLQSNNIVSWKARIN